MGQLLEVPLLYDYAYVHETVLINYNAIIVFSAVQHATDIHSISGVGSSPIFRQMAVIILAHILIIIHLKIRTEQAPEILSQRPVFNIIEVQCINTVTL
jgi:hypothetical protein